jgi:hypothetical protein
VLKVEGHGFSPTLLHRILLMAGTAESFESAATALQIVGEVRISPRTVNELGAKLGRQMREQRQQRGQRGQRGQEYLQRDLPRVATVAQPPVPLAAVFCDGGRMRTRKASGEPGVQEPPWRETKNAAFHRMTNQSFAVDPQPILPECFRNQAYVEKLVLGLKKARNPQPELMPSAAPELPAARVAPTEPLPWQPQSLLRTCLSSLACSDDFGLQMAAEADARGFYAAVQQAFLGDGQAYNWTIPERWFPTFTPIADFIHLVEYLSEAAKALHADPASRWTTYLAWTQVCWQGDVSQVIDELLHQASWATEAGVSETTLAVLQRTRTYLTHNRERMDYPRYRREGLPVTSSLAESLVKQISKRVKGTEKFWDDGPRGEAILQIRAAVISQDNRLQRCLAQRPISPYSSRCRAPTPASAA